MMFISKRKINSLRHVQNEHGKLNLKPMFPSAYQSNHPR